MDLRPRLALAGGALLGLLDAEQEFMPTGGYEVAHDLGRWWDAVLRLEETLGFAIPGDLEAASLRNLQRLTDNPDALLMNRPDVPWLRDRVKLNPHNFRETLLAFGGLVRRRRSAWARERGLHLVNTMRRVLRADGSFDFPRMGTWSEATMTRDPSHAEEKRDGWFDGTATSGRSLEALVWFYEATGEPAVLDLARRIAEHHLANSTCPDGSPRPEIFDPVNIGHDHSYQGTLRGLLLFGLLTGQREYVQTVEATYRKTVRGRLVTESGWAPHDLGKLRFPNACGDPVTDPASTGDAAQLALWLALHAGAEDLLDDVERYVRARLLPAQLTPDDARRVPERAFPARDIGAWAIHGPSHAGKGCTPDVLAAVTHTLCDVHRHVCTPTPAGLRVNLHFDWEDDRLRIVSRRQDTATVTVQMKRPDDLLLRIPQWAPKASVGLTVDGAEAEPVRLGAFAWIARDRLHAGSEIVLTYALPERTSEERMPSGRVYQFRWRGDEVVGVSPQEDDPFPFYAA